MTRERIEIEIKRLKEKLETETFLYNKAVEKNKSDDIQQSLYDQVQKTKKTLQQFMNDNHAV
jgi:hypothetical protein